MPPPNSPPPTGGEDLPLPPPPPPQAPPEGEITRFLWDYRNGNPAALDALLAYTYERLRHIARQMLRRFPAARSEVETDDLSNKAVIALQQALAKVDRTPGSSKHLFRYAARMMRHQLIDLMRRLELQPGARSGLDQVPGAAPDPADLARWRELHELVGRLDEHLQEVVDLRVYQGLTFVAIGRELDLPEWDVRRNWEEALKKLRRYLDGGEKQ